MNSPESKPTLPRRKTLAMFASGLFSFGLAAAQRRVHAESAIPDLETYENVEEAVGQEEMEKFSDVEAKFAFRNIRAKILLWNGALPYPETQQSRNTKQLRTSTKGSCPKYPRMFSWQKMHWWFGSQISKIPKNMGCHQDKSSRSMSGRH